LTALNDEAVTPDVVRDVPITDELRNQQEEMMSPEMT